MQIFRELAGYSFGHADIVRRAMSKKKAAVMEAERSSFLAGCEERGITPDVAGAIFDDLAMFAHYAFNKSHAAAYAVITYRTAYLKAHYPKAYFAALLTSELGNLPKIAEYITEAGKFGVRVLPPDINESEVAFHVSGDHVRFGLLALKNVGRSFLDATVRERARNGAYTSFDDFLDRMEDVDLNRRQIESLIKAGAFDALGVYRSRLLAVCGEMLERLQSRNRTNLTGQLDMFSTTGTARPKVTYPSIPEFGAKELLMQEKEATGMYFSGHLLDGFSKSLADPRIKEIRALLETDNDGELLMSDRARVCVAGIVTSVTAKTTKKDERMAFFTLEDHNAEIECIVFPKTLSGYGHLLRADAVLRVEGTLSVREDEKPKVLISVMEELADNEHYVERAPRAEAAVSKKPQPSAPRSPKILYLRVPSFSSEEWKRVSNLLGIFEGTLPVSVYDASSKSYHKQETGVDCTPYTIGELQKILGAENVVLK